MDHVPSENVPVSEKDVVHESGMTTETVIGHRTQHTPGPWIVKTGQRGYPRSIGRPIATYAPGEINAIVRWNGIGFPSSKEGQANARLIAAAPDMLAALRAAEREMENVRHNRSDSWALLKSLNDVSDAIAKAEGRS